MSKPTWRQVAQDLAGSLDLFVYQPAAQRDAISLASAKAALLAYWTKFLAETDKTDRTESSPRPETGTGNT